MKPTSIKPIDKPTDGADRTLDVLHFERDALRAIFAPKSVAVIGATEKTGAVGRTVLWNLISNPFGGTVYPVNKRHKQVLGIRAYADIARVPETIDLAIIVTPAPTVPGIVKECVAAGVKSAIIISAGFKEAGAAGVELALSMHHRLGDRAHVSLVTGGGAPLPSHPAAVQRRALRALKRRNVTVLEDSCAEITASQVVLSRGTRVACDAAVIALGAFAPPWLRNTGLALDERGFVATGPTLQSSSHPEVFAAGDVSTRTDEPHPKSGVYAVRAGAPLALNLRRFLAGGPLEPWQPQRRALNLLACGERYAIASWGGWSAQGAWVWRWKDRIDRDFIRLHSP